MNFLAVQRILGLLVMLVSVTMLPPLGVSLYYGDGNWQPFAHAFFALLAVGALIWWPVRSRIRELRRRDGFLVVALFWFVVSAAGAVPLLLAEEVQLSVTNAVFESVSGYTTTGATVLSGLDSMPQSLLWYRVQMEWLGGIGMVVLAVALLPMLGVGGMQLMRAETPGPIKDSKLTPRITGTAKELCRIYIAFTIACALAYWWAGMTPFDAIAHSFSTVSTGGNSTHDANFAFFDNEVIEGIAVFFMFLGSVNFSLHFLAWRHKRLSGYFRDPEFRAYCWVLALAIAVYFAVLWLSRPDIDAGAALRRSLFHAVSMQSTTAFFTDDFTHWPGALPVILMLSTFVGGCAGSTSGGHEGRALAAAVEAGSARSRAARAPERGGAGQARREGDRSAHRRCRMGLLRRLHRGLRRADGAADRHRRRSGYGVLGHRGLHEQRRNGPRRSRGEFRDAERPGQMDLPGGHAAGPSGSLPAAGAGLADLLAALNCHRFARLDHYAVSSV